MDAGCCPVCGKSISPLQAQRDISYSGRTITLHHRCWYENQEVIAELEQRYPGLSLEEALRKLREG